VPELVLAASTTEIVLTLIVATVLFLVWLYSLFVLVLDDISFGAKVLWFLLLTLLVPISVPTYLFLRHRRRAGRHAAAAADS
jgi:hypothetical protein